MLATLISGRRSSHSLHNQFSVCLLGAALLSSCAPQQPAMLARRASAVPTGLGKATDVVVERAEGALVHDVDGNTFIDFVGGIGALAVGHCPPTVVEAMHEEAQRLVHMCSLVGTYESYVRVCELLNEVTPGTFPKKTLLSNSGAEAVENAVKAARAYTRRPAVICFEAGYHGRTLLTLLKSWGTAAAGPRPASGLGANADIASLRWGHGQASRGSPDRLGPGSRPQHPRRLVPYQRCDQPVRLGGVGEGPPALVAVPLLIDLWRLAGQAALHGAAPVVGLPSARGARQAAETAAVG